jgi:hypothetical protein
MKDRLEDLDYADDICLLAQRFYDMDEKLKRLTFKNRASYIQDGRCICILYIFSTTISTEYFKHAAHSPLFSSKCHLFHNATFFGYCIIHILHTGCAKI